jgi:hypothetical protein
MNEPIKVFLSYSHKDEELRQELISHLSGLQHQGLIEPWHDRNISAGSEWADQIDQNLEQADIILFLVSADFINSRYRYSIEMKRALERHRAKTACTIPVIIRDCDWKSTDLHQLNGIPRDNRHVTGWGDKFARDSAWRQVSEEIGKVARQIWAERDTQITAAQKAQAKQEFRAKAEVFYVDGVISPTEQRLLNRAQQELGLEEPEAEEILRVVAVAYQQHQTNLEDYLQTLIAEWAGQDELKAKQWELLQQLQTALDISDPEVEQIKQKVLAERARELQKVQDSADPIADTCSKISVRKSVPRSNSTDLGDTSGTTSTTRRKSVPKLTPQDLLKAYGRGKRDFSRCDLSNLSFPRIRLADAIFHEAQLQNSDLRGADLNGANLGKANLRGANLRNANLQLAYISNADLEGADLRGADLRNAYLSNANLRGANLTEATLMLKQLNLAHLNWMTILPNGKRGRRLW